MFSYTYLYKRLLSPKKKKKNIYILNYKYTGKKIKYIII